MRLAEKAAATSGARYVYLFDEDFLLKSQRWIEEFTNLYVTRIGLPFFIFATPWSVIRFPEKVLALTAVGLDTINMGIQSGSTTINTELFKRYRDAGAAREAIHFLVELHQTGKLTSPPMLDVIVLNPYEETQDVMKTLHLLLELPTPFETAVHCMSFFEGTPLKTKAISEARIPRSYRFRFDLHDFESRLHRNELKLDYTNAGTLEWLHLNALLYCANGLHTVQHGQRWVGAITEERLLTELGRVPNIALQHVRNLIHKVASPMEDSLYAWEQRYVCAGSTERRRETVAPAVTT